MATTEQKHTPGPLHPFCNTCGWRKGGVDSWNGAACKCGHSEPPIPTNCNIKEGGGAHFGGDLWKCIACGTEKYPEAFKCPYGYTAAIAKASV